MASRHTNKTAIIALVLALVISLVPVRSMALSQGANGQADTALMQFVQTVVSGQEGVTGVYVAGRFSFPVIQQPEGNPSFVSPVQDTITQFGMAADQKNVGLLAHNYLAGIRFFELRTGDRVYLVFGTGRVEAFAITRILQYQALDAENPYSEFRPVDGTARLSSTDMFNRVYTGPYHITFQTCIAKDGNGSWGRIFIIAEPLVSAPL
jgi:hypothetical protein